MYNANKKIKFLSLILVFCLAVSISFMPSRAVPASAQEMSAEDEKALIEERIKELNNKLNELDRKSADTQEYLSVLNEKIVYLTKELDAVSSDVEKSKSSIAELKQKHDENERLISESKSEITVLSSRLAESEESFNKNYELYCQRLYVMYVSGETNLLSFLIESEDISELLTRYEMVRRVSQQDGNLLKEIQSEMDGINKSKNEITEKTNLLSAKQAELEQTTKQIEEGMLALQQKQISLDKKRTSLSSERAQANLLLKKLGEEKGIYTEYLEDDRNTLDEIDKAIEEAEKELVTTTTTKLTTTTTKPNSTTQSKPGSTTTSSKTTTKPDGEGKYISLTYPVPSQKRVTCSMQDYAGHSGCDFSCPTGSRVVAAESGTVIISTDLTNPDGSYRSYGRYIVIMHDKTTKSGNKVYTLYAHNSERLVAAGTHVEKGQLIAKSGSTGNSTGPHCHFEVRTPTSAYKDCKDPEIYLP